MPSRPASAPSGSLSIDLSPDQTGLEADIPDERSPMDHPDVLPPTSEELGNRRRMPDTTSTDRSVLETVWQHIGAGDLDISSEALMLDEAAPADGRTTLAAEPERARSTPWLAMIAAGWFLRGIPGEKQRKPDNSKATAATGEPAT